MLTNIIMPTPESLKSVVKTIKPFLKPGNIIFLDGPLGSGKTTLVRAVMDAVGSEDLVASPSFSIINVYQTPSFPVAHFDLYRLEGEEDLETIGADDYLNGSHLIFVEWPERSGNFFPAPSLTIEFEIIENGDSRVLSFREAANG